jgi:hypothetical protein
MKKLLLLSIPAFLFCACNNAPTSEKNMPGDSVLSANTITANVINDGKFVVDENKGILIDDVISVYDTAFNKLTELKLMDYKEVEILSRTPDMYNRKGEKDICDKANYVKIRFDNTEYIVFGKNVYILERVIGSNFMNANNENCSLYLATGIKIGSANEEGSTGCDEYSVLLVKREKDSRYVLVEQPENRANNTSKQLINFVIYHDNGCGESIYRMWQNKDTMMVGVKAHCQEGGYSGTLKLLYHDYLCKSWWTEETAYTEEEMHTKWQNLK